MKRRARTGQRKNRPGAKRIPRQGLCLNCRLAETCRCPADPPVAVIFCEEFDIGNSAPGRHQPRAGHSRQRSAEEDEAVKGLCSDCESRRLCTNAGEPGGIWHCEEYR